MSEATAPVNLSPGCVVALSRVCVMRTGIDVPAGTVMLCTTGAGGGGFCWEDGSGAGALRTMGGGCGGAYCGIDAEGLLPFSGRIGTDCAYTGAAAGGANEAIDGAGACTTRLLTTVFIPATWAASPLAIERAESLVTLPLRVTMPFATDAWIGWPLRLWSDERRLCTCAFRLASSAGGLLLQPTRPTASESAMLGTQKIL